MKNNIELKSIDELLGMSFFIPAYQRGYRWNTQQVKDLLEDIQEFIDKKKEGFYCIQPLVVRRNIPDTKISDFKAGLEQLSTASSGKVLVDETEKLIFKNTQWEVIDGQQRLTTIHILLQVLDSEKRYFIEYQTRKGSKEFLDDIDEAKKKLILTFIIW